MCGLSAIVEFEPATSCFLASSPCIDLSRIEDPDGEGFVLLDSALTASARADHSIAWVRTRKSYPRSNKDAEVEMIG